MNTNDLPPNVVIKTLPLTAGNYGGTLQAYALQECLRQLGMKPLTDTPVRVQRTWKDPLRFLKTVLREGSIDRVPDRRQLALAFRELENFVRDNLNTADLSHRSARAQVRNVRAVVVGSDQVWRRAYMNTPGPYFLDFADSWPQARRLSYAASFGTGDLSEYSPSELRRCAELIRYFDAVSVREESGIPLARKLGADAERHADPTFLLHPSAWRELAGISGVDEGGERDSCLAVMVLDEDPRVSEEAGDVATELGLTGIAPFYPSPIRSRRAARAQPAEHRLPSVSSWISTIANAPLVITDSFHVCVFSIILQTPFVALGNESRGQERFRDLLSRFGLQDRLVSGGRRMVDIARSDIRDWDRIREIVNSERRAGIDYLRRNLALIVED